MKAVKIYVAGMVQGVGFRPFIRRIAYLAGVDGYVKNLGGGEVEIHVEAEEVKIKKFLKLLREKKPPPARIDKLQFVETEPINVKGFKIMKSGMNQVLASEIPQDLAMCDECLKEILDPGSRWYRYPFNSCAWCGPRYSMIYRPPYDRENTAMNDFPLCEECRSEYQDLWNERRYHAQGISCPRCGPSLSLLDKKLNKIEEGDPLSAAAELIDSGAIVAVKGIGGYHLACLASDDEVVLELRKRKRRPRKPFALMALDLNAARKIVEIPKEVEEIFRGQIRPIILLPKRAGAPVSSYVAPSLSNLGVMLPYTPLHYLLLGETRDKFLIMTSGNVYGDPMISDDSKLGKLAEIADYILTHNRRIVHRIDDSVIRPTHGQMVILRFGRGYAPKIIKLGHKLNRCVIAYGAELETSGAIGFDDKIILAPYSGDLDNPVVLKEHESSLEFLARCYKLHERSPVVAADLHPTYRSRAAAEKFASTRGHDLKLIQHHFAHMASVMAEVGHDPSEPAVGVMMDGVGYGLDGAIWGGEVIIWSGESFSRTGFIEYSLMPGGDLAAKRPARMLASILSKFMEKSEISKLYRKTGLLKGLKHGEQELQAVLDLVEKNKGPWTSSTGRFLDSASALLNLCLERSYEGEPAIILENASIGGKPLLKSIDPFIDERDGKSVISSGEILKILIENLHEPKRDLAYTAQYLLGACFGVIAGEKARSLGVKTIYISGGAAVNQVLLKAIEENSASKIYVSKMIPPGDGGIAVGQAYIAGAINNAR